MKDCLNNPAVNSDILSDPHYSPRIDLIGAGWVFLHIRQAEVLSNAVSLMEMFVVFLKELKKITDAIVMNLNLRDSNDSSQ